MKVQVRFRVWVFIESFSLRMSRHLGSLHQSLPQTKRSQWSLTIEQRTSLMWSCTAPDSPCLQAVYWKCSGKRIGIQCLRLLPAANFLRPGIWQPVSWMKLWRCDWREWLNTFAFSVELASLGSDLFMLISPHCHTCFWRNLVAFACRFCLFGQCSMLPQICNEILPAPTANHFSPMPAQYLMKATHKLVPCQVETLHWSLLSFFTFCSKSWPLGKDFFFLPTLVFSGPVSIFWMELWKPKYKYERHIEWHWMTCNT